MAKMFSPETGQILLLHHVSEISIEKGNKVVITMDSGTKYEITSDQLLDLEKKLKKL